MTEPQERNLTGGRTLARNTVFNFVGQGAPLLLAVIAIPLLISGLGTERFGILTLAWMVIGYFSLFDLGLGRALTKLVAEKLGEHKDTEIPTLVWTSLALMGALGLLGTVAMALLSPALVQEILKIPADLQTETLDSFYLLSFSIPVVVSTAALRGILEAHQRFDLVNAVRVPMGLFTFAGPLSVLPFSRSLFWVIAVLLLGRIIAWAVHFWLCIRILPALRQNRTVSSKMARTLLNLGWWMTVSNIIGPLMVTFDRFLIGALLSIAAVTYYTTPYEVVTKLWMISGAFIGVLFPAFSTSFAQNKKRTAQLFDLGLKYIYIAMFPVTLALVTFADEGLTLWLNADFSQNSTNVMQWLAVGVFVNSLAQIPFALVQGAGRPDITAKMHLIELPFYLLAVWWLINNYGIDGAAIAWVARVGIDTVVFFAAAYWILPETSYNMKLHAISLVAGSFIFLSAAQLPSIPTKMFFFTTVAVLFLLATWFKILTSDDKLFIKQLVRRSAK